MITIYDIITAAAFLVISYIAFCVGHDMGRATGYAEAMKARDAKKEKRGLAA